MADLTNVSAVIAGPETVVPFGFSLLIFLIMFSITVGISTLILWQVVRLFKHGLSLKKAFLASLIANVINSAFFTALIVLLRNVSPDMLMNPAFAAMMAIWNWLIIFAVNLTVAVKLYRLPVKKLIYPIMVWILLLMLVGWVVLPIITQLAGQLLATVYPFTPQFIEIGLPPFNTT